MKTEFMKVEFKNLQDKFEVIEYVIRKTSQPWEDTESDSERDTLQARLLAKDFDENCVRFSISYYSSEDDFLGLDTSEDQYISPSQDRSIPISAVLSIPERTERAVVRFIFDDETRDTLGFYGTILKIAAVIGVGWMGLLLFKAITATFG